MPPSDAFKITIAYNLITGYLKNIKKPKDYVVLFHSVEFHTLTTMRKYCYTTLVSLQVPLEALDSFMNKQNLIKVYVLYKVGGYTFGLTLDYILLE